MTLFPALRSFRPKTKWTRSFSVGAHQRLARQLPHRALESDIIGSIPDNEDTDEGMAAFLLEARRRRREKQASSDGVDMTDATAPLPFNINAPLFPAQHAGPSRPTANHMEPKPTTSRPPPTERNQTSGINTPAKPQEKESSTRAQATLQNNAQNITLRAGLVPRFPSNAPSKVSSRTMVTSAASEAAVASTSKATVASSDVSTTDRPKPKHRSSSSKRTDKFELPLSEFATWIQENYTSAIHGAPFPCQALKDQTVFLAVSDVGKHKAERERLITIRRLGGNVADKYDSDTVTMIATTKTAIDNKSAAKALGISRLTKVPKHIKIVLWDYMVECQHAEDAEIPRSTIRHVLYEDRKPSESSKKAAKAAVEPASTASDPAPSKRRKRARDDGDSDGSYTTPKKPDPKQVKLNKARQDQLALSSSLDQRGEQPAEVAEDPLAELYDEAAAELAREQSSSDVEASQDQTPEAGTSQLDKEPAKGFACLQEPQETTSENPNQYIIDKLKELRTIYQNKQGDTDTFKVFGLNKVIGDLSRVKHKITTREQALKLNGSGAKTADKIMEIIQTGDLQRIKAEDTEEYRVCRLFSGIYDVGAKRAHQWYRMGLRTLEDVEKRKDEIRLTRNQAIGLKYYDDLQERIPRPEATAIFDKIKETALAIDGNLTLYIMGSYRRGEQTVGDIDLLLTRDPSDGITHAGVLNKLIDRLHEQGILTEDLAVPSDNRSLEQKYMGLCRLPPDGKMRRIDILAIPYDQKGAALIYFTGDDLFNRSIRLLAHKKGYSLNQRGLYGGVARDSKRKKISEGVIIASKTEREIFDVLGVPWREPHERRRM